MLLIIGIKADSLISISCSWCVRDFGNLTLSEQMLYLNSVLDQSVTQLRQLIFDLVPVELVERGLAVVSSHSKDGRGQRIRIMQYRASRLGGMLEVGPNFLKGTLVICRIPEYRKLN